MMFSVFIPVKFSTMLIKNFKIKRLVQMGFRRSTQFNGCPPVIRIDKMF